MSKRQPKQEVKKKQPVLTEDEVVMTEEEVEVEMIEIERPLEEDEVLAEEEEATARDYISVDGKLLHRDDLDAHDDDLDAHDLREGSISDDVRVDEKCRSLFITPWVHNWIYDAYHHVSVVPDAYSEPCYLGTSFELLLADARIISTALTTLSEVDIIIVYEVYTKPLLRLVDFIRNGRNSGKKSNKKKSRLTSPHLSVERKRDGTTRYFYMRSTKGGTEAVKIGKGPDMSLPVAICLAETLAEFEEPMKYAYVYPREIRAFLTVVPAMVHELLGIKHKPARKLLHLD